MREDAFLAWMKSQGTMGTRPMGDAVSRCKRVCKGLGVSLDAEFIKDGGNGLLAQLEYTTEDARSGKAVSPGLGFAPGANLRNGMSSLRSAAKRYFEFCEHNK